MIFWLWRGYRRGCLDVVYKKTADCADYYLKMNIYFILFSNVLAYAVDHKKIMKELNERLEHQNQLIAAQSNFIRRQTEVSAEEREQGWNDYNEKWEENELSWKEFGKTTRKWIFCNLWVIDYDNKLGNLVVFQLILNVLTNCHQKTSRSDHWPGTNIYRKPE